MNPIGRNSNGLDLKLINEPSQVGLETNRTPIPNSVRSIPRLGLITGDEMASLRMMVKAEGRQSSGDDAGRSTMIN